MASCVYRARAPGSLMMMGEHAVLHGESALVSAVNAWMQVELIPRDDRVVRVESALGTYVGLLDALEDDVVFRFVLEAVRRYGDRLPSGVTLLVESEFRSTIGFGSSAAVTVVVLSVLQQFCGVALDREALAREAREVIRAVQGRGSGADAAASVFGGMVFLDPAKDSFESVPFTPPVSMVYSGYKVATPEVVRQVDVRFSEALAEVERLYARMGACTGEAFLAAREGDLEGFGLCCGVYQGLMVELGVSTADLDKIAKVLSETEGMFGSKISGAGLGDCVIGVGSSEGRCAGYETVTVPLSLLGLCI